MAFHEIAVEPVAIKTLRDIQLVLGYMGFGKGRLIANYPISGPPGERKDEDWAWCVVQSVKRTEVEKAPKVRELLIAERRKILRTRRFFDYECEWITNARREHLKKPFGAIIAEIANFNEVECCLDDFSGVNFPQKLREDQHVQPLPKLPTKFAEALMPMLGCSKELRFIDPFFIKRDAEGRYVVSAKQGKVIQEVGKRLSEINRVPQIVEFHALELGGDAEAHQNQLAAFAKWNGGISPKNVESQGLSLE